MMTKRQSLKLGLFAPLGTPPEIVAWLNAEVNKVLQSPDVREKLAAQGIAPAVRAPEQFAAFVREDYARWGKVVKESGVKAE